MAIDLRSLMALALVGMVAGSASAATRTLQKNVLKDFDASGKYVETGGTSYPTKWAHYSGNGYWATAGSDEDKLEAGYDYFVPSGKQFRFPNTQKADLGQFPGDSLTVEHNGLFIYTAGAASVNVPGGLTLLNPLTITSPIGNSGTPGVHPLLTHIVSPVNFENNSGKAGNVTLTSNNNRALGQSYEDKVKADASLTFVVDTMTMPTDDYRYFFWAKFLGDTSEFLSAINVKTNAALFLGANGLANAGLVTLNGASNPDNSAALWSEAPGYVVPVKSLQCEANARLWIATSARGATSPFRVTDTYSQFGPVYVCLTNYPERVSNEETNAKLEILRVASGAGTLSKDDFVFRGYTASAGAVISDPRIGAKAEFSVESDEANGDSVLYLTLSPVVKCVKYQAGDQNWLDADGWSDNVVPHDDAAYLVPPNMSPRHKNAAKNVFGGKSLTLNGGTFQHVCVPAGGTIFPHDGLVLESGKYSLQYSDGLSGDQNCAIISGRVTVVSAPEAFSVICGNNRRKGMRFVSEVIGAAGTGLTLEGSVNHDDPVSGNPRQAAMLVAFDGDNSQFFGSVVARTNTICALGDGPFAGQVTVKGETANLKESGAVRTWEADDICTLGSLVLEANGIVDVVNDATTGASGRLVVANELQYAAPVQVYLAKLPARALHGRYPVLTLKNVAVGKLDKDDFTFAGFVSKETLYANWTPEFTVETADNGDKTLYLDFKRPGLTLLVR